MIHKYIQPGGAILDTNINNIAQMLHLLGRPARRLETIPNPYPGRSYTVTFTCSDFKLLDPMIREPVSAIIRIQYTPEKRILVYTSLHLYLGSFERAAIPEQVPHQILDDLVHVLNPIDCQVVGSFNEHGFIPVTVEAKFKRPENIVMTDKH
jgi:7-cyano-7-deazaguanine reductase